MALNKMQHLSELFQKRLPPPPNPVQLMCQFEVAVENIVSNQSQIHARVDCLISLLLL
jgi:hypothetical protein